MPREATRVALDDEIDFSFSSLLMQIVGSLPSCMHRVGRSVMTMML